MNGWAVYYLDKNAAMGSAVLTFFRFQASISASVGSLTAAIELYFRLRSSVFIIASTC